MPQVCSGDELVAGSFPAAPWVGKGSIYVYEWWRVGGTIGTVLPQAVFQLTLPPQFTTLPPTLSLSTWWDQVSSIPGAPGGEMLQAELQSSF